MKRFFAFILIGAFLIPALGNVRAFAASKDVAVQTPAISPLSLNTAEINTHFKTILDTLTDLTKQTQDATDQLNLNGIDTTEAQTAIDATTADITKAKLTLATPKYGIKTAQIQIQDAKNDILSALSILKASLPTLNQLAQ